MFSRVCLLTARFAKGSFGVVRDAVMVAVALVVIGGIIVVVIRSCLL